MDDGNPYKEPVTAARPNARTQIGFGTFGGPHILSLVCEVATRALKTVWYQKWFVNRRLRPEEYGGLVHLKLEWVGDVKAYRSDRRAGARLRRRSTRTFAKYGSYLLPQAFPEGSPTHPVLRGGARDRRRGLRFTVLKAWFDENAPMMNPFKRQVPKGDGPALVPYTGGDAGRLTVGGELNKVAANIAIARNMAGVHWRSDYFALDPPGRARGDPHPRQPEERLLRAGLVIHLHQLRQRDRVTIDRKGIHTEDGHSVDV